MMNILFISYAEVSLCNGGTRAVAMLRALADAGHHIDLAAPPGDLLEHPQIHLLLKADGKPPSRTRLRVESLRAAGRVSYDAVHAVDDAVFFARRLCGWKKIPLVYDAVRCFSGKAALGTSWCSQFFPQHIQRMEAKVLRQARVIFSSCTLLTTDLYGLDKKASIVQVEDIPIQPLYALRALENLNRLNELPKRPNPVIVCCVLPGHAVGFSQLLMAARKVLEAMPGAVFCFKGALCEQAEKMAANLDIANHCIFLSPDESEAFLAALEVAHSLLLVPAGKSRYIHPQVYTLLRAGVPLVSIHDTAYDEVLTEQTSIRVLPHSESMVEGLLRAINEPLFSRAIAAEGQRRVVENHTYSSFKHKIRMTYHAL